MKSSKRVGWWMSGAYFTFYAGIACWAPYIVLYYQKLGLNGAEIGMLNALGPLGMAFLSPVWGSLADTWSAHRLILRIALLVTAVVALLLSGVSTFWFVLPLIIVVALVGTTASPLLDSYGVTLGALPGLSFGQMRVWGSIGFTIVVLLIGNAMGGDVSRLFLFAYAATLLLTCIATLGLPARKQQGTKQAWWRGAATLVRLPKIRVLLLTVFLLSLSANPIFALFGIYIQALGGNVSVVGVANAVASASEIPIIFLGSWLLARFGSQRMLVIALVLYCVRMALYGVVSSANWVLAIQALHGCTFGLYLVSSVTLMFELVGRERAATAQGLLASAMAFGQMTGSLLSGVMLDRAGIFAIYRFSAFTMMLALLMFVLGTRWYANRAEVAVPASVERVGEA